MSDNFDYYENSFILYTPFELDAVTPIKRIRTHPHIAQELAWGIDDVLTTIDKVGGQLDRYIGFSDIALVKLDETLMDRAGCYSPLYTSIHQHKFTSQYFKTISLLPRHEFTIGFIG